MTEPTDKHFKVLQQLGTESVIEYVELSEVLAMQQKVVERFGGTPGVRDPGLLASAVSRPMNLAVYEGVSCPLELGASLFYGIIKNHAFHDGNKRTAFMSLVLFLQKNQIAFDCDPNATLNLVREVARGDLDETGFASELKLLLDPIIDYRGSRHEIV